MRTKSLLPSIVFVALLITTAKTLRSQNSPHSSSDADRAKHVLAITLLRVINTTEAEYRMSHGAYAAKERLLASDEFKKRGTPWATKYATNAPFSTGPEVLPGWSLRLNVTADGQSYDLLLEDTIDKSCSYAAVTEERGIIRESRPIGCAI